MHVFKIQPIPECMLTTALHDPIHWDKSGVKRRRQHSLHCTVKQISELSCLPEESVRDSDPDDTCFLQLLLRGKVRTAAGSTQSVAKLLSAGTHCALLESFDCAEQDKRSLTTFSICWLAEKLLHIQSWIMMELKFSRVNSAFSLHGPSCSSSCPKNWDIHSSLSPGDGAVPSSVLTGDMGGVGTSSNFFQMSSLGAVDLKKKSSSKLRSS